jgi:hypothetical protein
MTSDENGVRRRREVVERDQGETRSSETSPAIRTLIFLIVLEVILMGFCLILAKLDERDLAILAGTAAVGLTVEIGRRVLITYMGGGRSSAEAAATGLPTDGDAAGLDPAEDPPRREIPKDFPDRGIRPGYFD